MVVSKHNLLYLYATFIFLIFVLIFRIYLNYISDIPLHFDEAQYWGWSKNLEWGYYSKPPMLAWLIRLNNYYCGETEFCIRLSTPILYFISSIFVFLSVKILTKSNLSSGFGATVFNLMPGITFSTFISNTDVPLIFFSSLFSFIFLKIYTSKSTSYFNYIFLGIVFGLGFLSKYAMTYLLFSIFIISLLFTGIKEKFLNKKSLIFFLTFLLIIIPHLFWNYNNGFVTFNHTAENTNFKHINLNFKEPFLFLFSQFIVFGIYPFYLILRLTVKLKSLDEQNIVLLIFFLTPILLISILSLFSRANANWAAVSFPFGCILLSNIFYSKGFLKKRSLSIISQISLSLLIIILIFYGKNFGFDPFTKIRHGKELAKYVSLELKAIENVAFMADDREDFALMLYYVKDFKGKRVKWNGDIKVDDHYELTTDANKLANNNILFLTRTMPTQEMLDRVTSYKLLKSFQIINKSKVKNYNLYLFKKWKAK